MNDQRQLLALAKSILSLPHAFRERLFRLLVCWPTAEEALRVETTKRLEALERTPDSDEDGRVELLDVLDRMLDELERSTSHEA